MTLVRITWTITHLRPLGQGEPVDPGSSLDADLILWALDEGEVRVSVELMQGRSVDGVQQTTD